MRNRWLWCVAVLIAIGFAPGCDGGSDGDPGEGGGAGADTSGGNEGGAGEGGENGGNESGGNENGGEGAGPSVQAVVAALQMCSGCHGGGACSTGVCFLDNPAILKQAPASGSAWCKDGEATIAECSVNLMSAELMPPSCGFSGNCAAASDVDVLQGWIDAGFPD